MFKQRSMPCYCETRVQVQSYVKSWDIIIRHFKMATEIANREFRELFVVDKNKILPQYFVRFTFIFITPFSRPGIDL